MFRSTIFSIATMAIGMLSLLTIDSAQAATCTARITAVKQYWDANGSGGSPDDIDLFFAPYAAITTSGTFASTGSDQNLRSRIEVWHERPYVLDPTYPPFIGWTSYHERAGANFTWNVQDTCGTLNIGTYRCKTIIYSGYMGSGNQTILATASDSCPAPN
jgi:hypothetical protein